MASEFNEMTQRLKESFNGGWLKFLLQYTALGKLLNQENQPSPWGFFQIYFSSWWWTSLWTYSLMKLYYNNFNKFILSAMLLKNSKLYNEENINIFSKYYAHVLYLTLVNLNDAKLLTQANFAVVAQHANPINLAYALFSLRRAGVLTEANFAVVAQHANPINLASAFCSLQQAGILTEANRADVAQHDNPENLARAFCSLHVDEILTEANRADVVQHANPINLALPFCFLQRAGILTEANRDVVAQHANTHDLARALSYLKMAGILTETNFAVLIAPNHASLVSVQASQLIWNRFPAHLLSQANFERLVHASEHANPMTELQRVRDQILGVQARAGRAAHFNPNQSTHTASVHRSVSESATRLRGSYGTDLNLETKIAEIIAYVNGLDDSPKYLAAKSCIMRITARDYTFTDSSGVSTHQLLALAYAAIHDESKRQGRLDDAKALFIEGLYEIQRGYNLNDEGIDQGGEDRPICSAGTFNKLMEKLNGIHSDVEVYFITHEGAYAKFPKLVAHHALNYLNGLTRPETATDYLSIKELLDRIQDNGIEPIWDKIKSAVEEELWSEFEEAYANNRNHPQFRAMMDNGVYSNAPDLSELYSALQASPGYPQMIGLHEHSLWANRHASPEAQEVFDKRFGLAIVPSK